MRKLAMALLLSATLPAFASVQSDLESGVSAADAFAAANASCDTAACTDQVLADLFAAGVAVKDILTIATAAGVSADAAGKALIAAGAPADQALPATAAGTTTTPVVVVTPPAPPANISAS